jgi:hypothetical protein
MPHHGLFDYVEKSKLGQVRARRGFQSRDTLSDTSCPSSKSVPGATIITMPADLAPGLCRRARHGMLRRQGPVRRI